MRVVSKKSGVSVLGVGGIHVVLLAFDVTPERRKGLLGFAIRRRDPQKDEDYWLRGFKTFEETMPRPAPGSLVSTREHPVQAFLWGDYTVEPGRRYVYTVVPLYGKPKKLVEGPAVELRMRTSRQDLGRQTILFNRGVAGSQAYARKFRNVAPDRIEDEKARKTALAWLSRGLEEAILAFIAQARGKRFGLRASVYEFSHEPVLEAFRKASASGADVKIVYDRRGKAGRGKQRKIWQTSEAKIRKVGIGDLMVPRKTGAAISHNKFIVLLEKGKPVQVWTGSTNFSPGGIFGQSNVGQWVRDRRIAAAYHAYWTRLSSDPAFPVLRAGNDQATPDPVGLPAANSIAPLFSPRTSLGALEWYAERMDEARQTLGFTAAFGISSVLAPALMKKKPLLRYLMLESEGVSEGQRKDFARIRKVSNNRIALGSFLRGPAGGGTNGAVAEAVGGDLHRWLAEKLTGLNVNVKFLHTKYLLVDPLTDQPIVISGSANFSSASTRENDENMLVMRGARDVSDAFLGEFMRLFNHFYFRSVAQRHGGGAAARKASLPYLEPNDSWTKAAFRSGSQPYLERKLYAGAM
jgi:phosphatidylserine/phosphatidylglycerophosphate/cardiolipin synthase-like enzyme